jgi:predicted MPP superfamily phosphohydrolase
MASRGISRRRLFFLAALAAPAYVWADMNYLEPEWVKVRHVRLNNNTPTHRVVHFTDIHHKGDRPYLESVVQKINRLSPDIVCFTGDLIEEPSFIPETLAVLEGIKSPVYGIPGNHDYCDRGHFERMRKSFARTGGAWMTDAQATSADGKIHVTGLTCLRGKPAPILPKPGSRNILLMHYPIMAEKVAGQFDLILAGHSHGGQVRIPFYGPLMLPYWVGKYDLGLFRLKAGPLYVNPGIGWIATPVRFNCRPEITVFDI